MGQAWRPFCLTWTGMATTAGAVRTRDGGLIRGDSPAFNVPLPENVESQAFCASVHTVRNILPAEQAGCVEHALNLHGNKIAQLQNRSRLHCFRALLQAPNHHLHQTVYRRIGQP